MITRRPLPQLLESIQALGFERAAIVYGYDHAWDLQKGDYTFRIVCEGDPQLSRPWCLVAFVKLNTRSMTRVYISGQYKSQKNLARMLQAKIVEILLTGGTPGV